MGACKRNVVLKAVAVSGIILGVVFVSFPVSAGQENSGYEIMKKVRDRELPKTVKSHLRMILIDKIGRKRVRELITFAKREKGLTKTLTRFIKPNDVVGTGFLQIEVEEGKNIQYLYLPSRKRVRRIPEGDKHMRFLGSDFTYEDLEVRSVDKDIHKFLREEKYQGVDCYVVESVPRDPSDSQYSRFVSWIRKDNYFPIRVDFYDKKGRLKKRLVVKKLELIDGYWIATESVMEDFQIKHKTIMQLIKVRNNEPIDDSLFSVKTLMRD